jgi:hypothetical protein
MLSSHISSAFAQERQSRYRREAAEERLAGRRSRPHRARGTGVARVPTADPPAPRVAPARRPSPAH